jgi:metal transporter CNNM
MAIVSRFSVEKATSVKKVAKRSLTQRLRERVGMGDSSDEDDDNKEEDNAEDKNKDEVSRSDEMDADAKSTLHEEDNVSAIQIPQRTTRTGRGRGRPKQRAGVRPDIEMGIIEEQDVQKDHGKEKKHRIPRSATALEQSMPADAVLTKKGAEDFLQAIDPAIMPLGIITLEDVLEGMHSYSLVMAATSLYVPCRTYWGRNLRRI